MFSGYTIGGTGGRSERTDPTFPGIVGVSPEETATDSVFAGAGAGAGDHAAFAWQVVAEA